MELDDDFGLDGFLLARVEDGGEDASRWTAERIEIHQAGVRRLVAEYRERWDAYRAVADRNGPVLEQAERISACASLATALRVIAQPYEGHPSYRPEWNPDWRPTPRRSSP